MKNDQAGFLYIELVLALAVISTFFLWGRPQLLLTEKMQVDYQAQYLVSNLRLIQRKNFSLAHETRAVPTPYIVINSSSYEVYEQPPDLPRVVNMPEGIFLNVNNSSLISFNRGDNYTSSAGTISIAGSSYSRKVIIHSYGRIRAGD